MKSHALGKDHRHCSMALQGLLRRGLTVPALREFMLAQGASRNVTYQEWDKLWTFNKKVIDPVCPRHTAVEENNKVLLRITNVSQTDYVTIDRHKKHPPAGKKTTMRSSVRICLAQLPSTFPSSALFRLDCIFTGQLQK